MKMIVYLIKVHEDEKRKNMFKRIISIFSTLCVLCTMVLTVSVNVHAGEIKNSDILIDGSHLTYNEYSSGTSSNPSQKGEHLMDGDSMIAKTGNGKIYTYGETTANHDVDFIAVLVYVDRYHEDTERWGQIDARVKEDRDTYYVVSTKTLMVDRGYFYRVRCEHFAGNDDEEFYDDTVSFTDGIWIP